MITRIFTDLSPDDAERVVNAVEAEDGTVSRTDQGDGKFTILATLPLDPPLDAVPASGSEFPWMAIARGEIGVKEGVQNNPRISEYFVATGAGPLPASVPWCSAFVNFCVKQAGFDSTGSAMARSWLTWGRDAGGLVPGCIVILERGRPPQGHVGFFVGMDGDRVRLLGGNQHDAVNIASFSAAGILGTRVPETSA